MSKEFYPVFSISYLSSLLQWPHIYFPYFLYTAIHLSPGMSPSLPHWEIPNFLHYYLSLPISQTIFPNTVPFPALPHPFADTLDA